MRKLLLTLAGIAALTAPTYSQIVPDFDPSAQAPRVEVPRSYVITAVPEVGMCIANFEAQGTGSAYMAVNMRRGSIVLGVSDATLKLTAVKHYDVALKRGDAIRILEYGLASINEEKVTSNVAVGIATEIFYEVLKPLSQSGEMGDFTYSLVRRGKDVVLFRLSAAEYEQAMTELVECGVANVKTNIWRELADPKTTWEKVEPTPAA